jgi:hypothetical protein
VSVEDDFPQNILQGMFRYGWISQTELEKLTKEEQKRELIGFLEVSYEIRKYEKEEKEVKFWMWVRVILAGACFFYFTSEYGQGGLKNIVFSIWIMYEIGYYGLRKEKAEREFLQAKHKYYYALSLKKH